jgi:hypothetical protein
MARSWVGGLSTEAFVLAATLAGTAAAHAAVTISTAATQNMSCSSGVCTPTAANAVLNVSDLTTMLGSSNVQVNTGTGSLAQQVEDIVVVAGFNWTSANSLTLDAYRSVVFDQPVAVNGSGAVSLMTNDGGSGGSLSFISGGNLSFLSTTSSLSINRKAYTLTNSIAALAADIAHKSSGHYALSANYDASQDGTYKTSPIPMKFKGTFNGLGNTISNLKISATKAEIGLFSYLDAAGSINSLRLSSAVVTARANRQRTASLVSAVAAQSYGTIFNTFASGQINISNVVSGVTVGGLSGLNFGVVLGSVSSLTILVTERKNSPEAFAAGGLVGYNDGTIETSFETGSVSLVGQTLSGVAGALVGQNSGPIENCYAEGDATMPSTLYIGGLVGETNSTIGSSYSTGTPTGGAGSDIGGLVGYDDHQVDGGTIADDYWDTTTSGITNLSQGAGNIANDPGITGETSAQLQAGLPTGFDPTIWAESPSINNGLPYLIANPPQ